MEEDSMEIHGVELCLEGFSKICFGGSGRIIGENWTRVVGFPLTALDKIGVAMDVGCTVWSCRGWAVWAFGGNGTCARDKKEAGGKMATSSGS